MKLVYIIGSLHLGGAERIMAELCGGMVQRGHDVTLIYSFKNRDFELNDRIKQIDLDSFEYDIHYGGLASRKLKKIGNLFKDYTFLKNYINTEKPDVITSFMQCWAWLLALAFRKRIHVVFSEHSSMLLGTPNVISWYKRNVLLPKADAVTVLTSFDQGLVYNKMRNAVCMPNPLTFAPISEEEYEVLFPLRRHILACGRLDEVKGFDNLIIAFSRIANQFPEWNLDIAGKDMPGRHYSEKLKSLVSELGMEGRVNFLGFHKDVKSLMKKYSIFCVTSRSEGFSLTLTEAMASGMATISYELTGPREITLNEVDGLLVDNQDIDSLAIGIKRLIESPQLRYSLGKRALTNVERYSSDVIFSRWDKLYERCLKKKK